jgi:hypothetical protein
MVLVFLATMYLLFPQLRKTVFGFLDSRGWNSTFTEVAKSEEEAIQNEMS